MYVDLLAALDKSKYELSSLVRGNWTNLWHLHNKS